MDNRIEDKDFKKILPFIKQYCSRFFTVECCGFLGKNKKGYVVQFVTNRSPNPQGFFCVDPIDFLKFKTENKFIALIHSHPNEDESFSSIDKSNSEATCLPSIVFSLKTNKFAIYEPKNHEVDVNILKKVKGYL